MHLHSAFLVTLIIEAAKPNQALAVFSRVQDKQRDMLITFLQAQGVETLLNEVLAEAKREGYYAG